MSSRGKRYVGRYQERPDDTFPHLVAAEVRACMARRGVTGEQLAKALGKSRGYVSRRLLNETALDVQDIQDIADVLDVDLVELLRFPVQTASNVLRAETSVGQGFDVPRAENASADGTPINLR